MTNKRNLLAGICALSFVPLCAAAETYFSVSGLAIMPATSEVRGTNSGTIDLTSNTGFGAVMAFGRRHANGQRTELELGFRETETNEFECKSSCPLIRHRDDPSITKPTAPATGHVYTSSLMLNHYFTFDQGAVRPYVGGGIGLAIHAFDVLTVDNVLQGGADGIDDALDDEAPWFAGQMMAGIEYGWARLGYRFFRTANAEVNGFEVSHQTHAIEFGIFW